MNEAVGERPRLVIIGAGFGGLSLAKALKRAPLQIVMVDVNNYHNFQPLMYQVATGGLEPSSIVAPVRRIFRGQENLVFRMAEVKSVDTAKRTLDTEIGEISYDFLVIATGSKNNFFNFDRVKEKLLTLKSIPDALELRNAVYRNLESALAHNRKDPLPEIMNVAIVGGGPAGLELAGALAEMKHFVLPKDFPDLDLDKMSIRLYEAAPQLLSAMSDEASEKSLEYLQGLGVEVFLETMVSDYDGHTLTMKDGATFSTDTVIWTAGVKAAPIEGLPEKSIVEGRISVDGYNQVKGLESVFAIGDVAAHVTEAEPKGLPMLAPVAQQQGDLLAKNIRRHLRGQEMEGFQYKDKGLMATIGRNRAVVDLPHYKFQGTFAWFVWMLVHIFSLIGFRSRIVALIDWLSNYLSYDRPLGVIIGKNSNRE